MQQLRGKTIFVTGGGRGLGACICRQLAQSGATVVVADLHAQYAEETAAAIIEAGGSAIAMQMDVGVDRDVLDAVRRTVGEFGKLDAVINNAATDKTVSVEDLAIEDWDRILATNLRGPFLVSKTVFPVMKNQGYGHIVNIASTASKRAWANASAYHASKWGLLGFSHALHVEARKHNVKVTALLCGGMRTPFLTERFPDLDLNNLQDPQNVAATVEFVLNAPEGTVIPEMMAIPMRETSWP